VRNGENGKRIGRRRKRKAEFERTMLVGLN
jgi:hypothetical protein